MFLQEGHTQASTLFLLFFEEKFKNFLLSSFVYTFLSFFNLSPSLSLSSKSLTFFRKKFKGPIFHSVSSLPNAICKTLMKLKRIFASIKKMFSVTFEKHLDESNSIFRIFTSSTSPSFRPCLKV